MFLRNIKNIENALCGAPGDLPNKKDPARNTPRGSLNSDWNFMSKNVFPCAGEGQFCDVFVDTNWGSLINCSHGLALKVVVATRREVSIWATLLRVDRTSPASFLQFFYVFGAGSACTGHVFFLLGSSTHLYRISQIDACDDAVEKKKENGSGGRMVRVANDSGGR